MINDILYLKHIVCYKRLGAWFYNSLQQTHRMTIIRGDSSLTVAFFSDPIAKRQSHCGAREIVKLSAHSEHLTVLGLAS
jgi:hypothetical protein